MFAFMATYPHEENRLAQGGPLRDIEEEIRAETDLGGHQHDSGRGLAKGGGHVRYHAQNVTQGSARSQGSHLRCIMDSYAWLGYFMGTGAGARVKEIVDSEVDGKLTLSGLENASVARLLTMFCRTCRSAEKPIRTIETQSQIS